MQQFEQMFASEHNLRKDPVVHGVCAYIIFGRTLRKLCRCICIELTIVRDHPPYPPKWSRIVSNGRAAHATFARLFLMLDVAPGTMGLSRAFSFVPVSPDCEVGPQSLAADPSSYWGDRRQLMRIEMTPEQQKLLQKIANANEREIYKAFLIQAQTVDFITTLLTNRAKAFDMQGANVSDEALEIAASTVSDKANFTFGVCTANQSGCPG
jgi:hypothetical protein